jgi:hypothetical protein
MAVINRKERFATEGIRFMRLNPDGTMPRPSRFVGFANVVDLSAVLTNRSGQLSIKIDNGDMITKAVTFPVGVNLNAVTVQQAITALNAANFPDITFMADPFTGRLMGTNSASVIIGVILTFINNSANAVTIPAGTYQLDVSGNPFSTTLSSAVALSPAASTSFTFSTTAGGVLVSQIIIPNFGTITPALPNGIGIQSSIPNVVLTSTEKNVQITGALAGAMDFGQGISHGGIGLEWISFFNDQTISIGLPKDVKDREEIDVEGAKGTLTRIIIPAMLQGLSPVVTLKEKDYHLLELIQGGKLDREAGTYDPPLSHDAESPTFFAEIYSPLYSSGSNKMADVAGYEKLLLRSMIGIEGDVPIEAKAWATYAFNLTATEYVDENGIHQSAWQEQSLSREQFDALKLKQI